MLSTDRSRDSATFYRSSIRPVTGRTVKGSNSDHCFDKHVCLLVQSLWMMSWDTYSHVAWSLHVKPRIKTNEKSKT